MSETKYEVLAPAGSVESMKAAIAAGADAVYMGGSRFGARAYAENPEEDMLLSAIDYAHLHGVRLYMTVNTLLKEKELKKDLIPFLRPYVEAGVDALIIQDFGVWETVREAFPKLPLHASTQMTITGPQGAQIAKDHGAVRIVTARELSVPEIRAIHEAVDVEIETFVHGAICYCYSGQCLLSSLIGGRSGNRGRCAQPCRLPYDAFSGSRKISRSGENNLMNLKDMCALDVLPDLLEAGVYSLKIEGRMKSPRYTAGVVSIYRKYVDMFEKYGRKGYHVEEQDKKFLLELFDRGGQTDGYFKKQNGRDMIALGEKPEYREVDQRLMKNIDEQYILREKKEKLRGKLIIKKDISVRMILECRGIISDVSGDAPMQAQNRPLTEADARKQFSKFGGTMFELESLEIEMDEGLFLPVKVMNDIRRTAVSELEKAILEPYRRKIPDLQTRSESRAITSGEKNRILMSVLVEETEQFEAAVSEPGIDRIYISVERIPWEALDDMTGKCRDAGKKVFLAMPRICRKKGLAELEKEQQRLDALDIDGYLLRVIDEISFAGSKRPDLIYAADHSLYSYNRRAEDFLNGHHFSYDTAPVELNARELEERGVENSEIIVYGRLPMMVSAQCFQNTLKGCSAKPCIIELQDRKKKRFPVKNYCRFCYNVVFNSDPLWLADEMEAIRKLDPFSIRLQFSTESYKETKEVIRSYETALSGGVPETEPLSFTRGHFRRGVE